MFDDNIQVNFIDLFTPRRKEIDVEKGILQKFSLNKRQYSIVNLSSKGENRLGWAFEGLSLAYDKLTRPKTGLWPTIGFFFGLA